MNGTYDVAIIGGGPAGLMAARCAAECGANVILIEKNDRMGKKLLLTGKERCNITCFDDNMRRVAEAFGKKGKFLLSALSVFGVSEVIRFFNEHGVPTKVENGKKVFPVSDKARDVLDMLLHIIEKDNVTVLTGSAVQSIATIDPGFQMVTENHNIEARSVIICTGGLSYPSLGSSGDGYKWAELLGHAIVPTEPSLVSIVLNESWIKDVQALEMKDVRISLYQNNKKQDECLGDAMFTQEGITGPMIIDLSRSVGQHLKQGPVTLEIDFCPVLTHKLLDSRLLCDLDGYRGKPFNHVLSGLLSRRLVPVFAELVKIDPTKHCDLVTRIERKRLLNLLKSFPVRVAHLSGFGKAIITAGGVSLKEINSQTMQSKIVPNLFFAGEILDLDGPSGGYNLQVCWSTGYVAGQSAANSTAQ